MKWLYNTDFVVHPRLIPGTNKLEDPSIAKEEQRLRLIGKIIDVPQATSYYTQEQLIKMGLRGVYLP